MKNTSLRILLMAIVLGSIGLLRPAAAHHSFASYDHSKTLSLKGTVKTFQWTNPHVVIWIVVQPVGGGAPEEWSVETTSPGVLTRSGWTRHSVKVGDRVQVDFNPLRDGSHGGGLNSVTLLDTGKKLVANFAAQEKPGLQ
jgi:hypothetical protein